VGESSTGYRMALARCVACGKCRAVCPVFAVEGDEASSARGKLKLLAAAEAGELAYDADLEKIIGDCLGCRMCVEECPQGTRVQELIFAARERIAGRRGRGFLGLLILRYLLPRRALLASAAAALGRLQALGAGLFRRPAGERLSPSQRTQRALAGVYRFLLPLAGLSPRLVPPTLATRPFGLDRGEVLHDAGPAAPRYGLFTGCALETAYPATGEAVIALAGALGITLIAPKGQTCCGLPAWGNGDRRVAASLAAVNSAAFAGHRLDGVITPCASCASFLRGHYTGPLADALTLEELLVRRLDDLPLVRDASLRVTYHQPCHLARYLKVDLAEGILSRLGDYIELPERDVCCGGAGSYFIKNPDTAARIGERKALNVLATGAGVVATSCPGCAVQIEASLARLGADVRVALLGELVAEALARSTAPPGRRSTRRAAKPSGP
jgi:glycolate oxidase iron-sulfur subunit